MASETKMRTTVKLNVNGHDHNLESVDPEMTLLEFVRSIGLTGTKLGCGEGGCGACTVGISAYDPISRSVKHASVNACLMPLVAADSCVVTTHEAL